MQCPHCAKQVPDDSTYCLYCGTRVAQKPQPYSSSAAMPWDAPEPAGAAPLPWSTLAPTEGAAAPDPLDPLASPPMPRPAPRQISPTPSSGLQASTIQGHAPESSLDYTEASGDTEPDSYAEQPPITNTRLRVRARAGNSWNMDENVYAYPAAPYTQDSYSKVQSQRPAGACILPALFLTIALPCLITWLILSNHAIFTRFEPIPNNGSSSYTVGPTDTSSYSGNITSVTYASSGVPPSDANKAAILGTWQKTGGDDTCCGSIGSLRMGEKLEFSPDSLKYGEVFGEYAYTQAYSWIDADHIQTSSGSNNGVYEISVLGSSISLTETGSMHYRSIFTRSGFPPTEVPLPSDLLPTDTPISLDTPTPTPTPAP